MVDSEHRQRDALPSIKHLDLARLQTEHVDHQRYSLMTTSTMPGSPTASTIYSGPPPPYSSSVSTAGPVPGISGYISPPQSTRRSTREDKDSPTLPATAKSLPSIHEALRDNRSIPFPPSATVVPPPQVHHQSLSAPNTGLGQNFSDVPKGPSNPFSQPLPPPQSSREPPYSNSIPPAASAPYESLSNRPMFPIINTSDPVAPTPQPTYPASPRRSSVQAASHYSTNGNDGTHIQSPHVYPTPRSSYQFSAGSFPPPPRAYQTQQQDPAHFEGSQHRNDQRSSFSKDPPYTETVKRELDVFDAETALKEMVDSSTRTLDFSRMWSQRSYQSIQNPVYNETLPSLTEIDEMMQHSDRVMQSLARIREIVIAQQHALSEQRIRAARGSYLNDEYGLVEADYRGTGGFAGGDAKKRRGKAAPPGRCHSCNRAETPEWRRGPDGARTLCNACGLHYAKLTRKMGPNKAAALTGSNLRPKTLDARSPQP